MDIKEIVDWMQQTQDRIQLLAALDTVVNLPVLVKVVNFVRVEDMRLLKKRLFLETNSLCTKL